MHLLRTTNNNISICEDGAGGGVGAGAVGAFAMPLFTSLVQRSVAPKAKVIKYSKQKKEKKSGIGLKEAYYRLNEGDPTDSSKDSFDTTGAIAKLKSLETKEKTDSRDTTTFGLEDDKGGLVRVTIKSDQAGDFEKALQAFMSDVDNDEELPEIAELLFDLKDRFDIIDVSWPDVEEDEEQEQGLEGQAPGAEGGADAGAEGGADLGLGDEGGGLDLDAGMPAEPAGDDTEKVSSLLASLIDTMKQDAIAKKKQAEVELAKIGMQQSNARVRQEEQMLDMDSYNKSKKDVDKESKRLAQLAQWKSETEDEGDEYGDSYSQQPPKQSKPAEYAAPEEEEEMRFARPAKKQQPNKGSTIRGRVHPHDIAQFILNRVK